MPHARVVPAREVERQAAGLLHGLHQFHGAWVDAIHFHEVVCEKGGAPEMAKFREDGLVGESEFLKIRHHVPTHAMRFELIHEGPQLMAELRKGSCDSQIPRPGAEQRRIQIVNRDGARRIGRPGFQAFDGFEDGVVGGHGFLSQWTELPGFAFQMRVMIKAPMRLNGIMAPTQTQALAGSWPLAAMPSQP